MNFGTTNNNNNNNNTNNNTGFITFKVQNKNDLRRFRMPASELLSQGGYLSLVERVRSLFSTSSQISLKWLDSDNDWITLTPVEDLNDIFSIAKANGFVKLSVDFEGNNQNQFGKFPAFPDLFRAASSSNTPNANANVNAGSTSANTNTNTRATNSNTNTTNANTHTNSSNNNTNSADSLADIFELFLGQKNPINTFLNGFTCNTQQQQQQQQNKQQQQSNPFLDFQAIGTVTRNVLHALHNYQSKENTSSTSSSSTSSSSSSSSRVHTHVSCDGCSASPIIGTRFKCIQCPDFDLCSTCEAAGVHGDHILIRLYKPLTPSRREFTSCFPFATASSSSSSSSGQATTSPCAPFSQFLSGQGAKPFNFQKPFNFSFPVKVEVEVDLNPASSETKQQQSSDSNKSENNNSNNGNNNGKQEENENNVDSESHDTNDGNSNNNEDDEYVFKPEASTTTPVSSSSSSSSESTPTPASASPSPKEIKIQLIKDMGFYDENLISRLLDEKWGRVDLVIAELLNFN